jgi:tetratricopeptide (TPR) repeat protein
MPQVAIRRRWRFFLVLITIAAVCVCVLFLAWSFMFPGLVKQGIAAYDRGDWNTAGSLAASRLQKVPDDKEALRLLARSSARQRHDELARAAYPRLGIAALKAEDFYLLGTVIDRLGDHEAAQECWEDGLRADPNHAEMLRDLAHRYLIIGRLSEATELTDRLATRPGWEAQSNLLFGEIKFENDDPAGAARCLTRALDLDPSAHGASIPPEQYSKLLAKSLLRTGKSTEAVRQLQKISTAGSDAEAFWLMSRSYLQEGAVSAASAALGQSGSYRKDNPLVPEPAIYVGSARCAQCHGSIYQSEQTSLHARTFLRGSELNNLALPNHPIPEPTQAGVTHTLDRSDGHVRFETNDRGKVYRAVVDYAFGSGDRGLTLVGRDQAGRARELRFSYYSDGSAWDVTPGHMLKTPTGEDLLGQLLTSDNFDACFFCHTTVARSAREQTGPESADRGIGCERCHGPGGNHLKAVALDFPDLAIANPSRGTGRQIIVLCGQCHSPLKREVSRSDPLAVRFPAQNLTWSRCYAESGGALDCVTCHDPHRDAEKTAAFYEARCLLCHSNSGAPPSHARNGVEIVRRTVCSVNPNGGCLPCHMPVVKTAIPHAAFTDHNIRVRSRTDVGVPSGTLTKPRA